MSLEKYPLYCGSEDDLFDSADACYCDDECECPNYDLALELTKVWAMTQKVSATKSDVWTTYKCMKEWLEELEEE